MCHVVDESVSISTVAANDTDNSMSFHSLKPNKIENKWVPTMSSSCCKCNRPRRRCPYTKRIVMMDVAHAREWKPDETQGPDDSIVCLKLALHEHIGFE